MCAIYLIFLRNVNTQATLEGEYIKLDNKVRFVLAVVSGQLVVSNRSKAELMKQV